MSADERAQHHGLFRGAGQLEDILAELEDGDVDIDIPWLSVRAARPSCSRCAAGGIEDARVEVTRIVAELAMRPTRTSGGAPTGPDEPDLTGPSQRAASTASGSKGPRADSASLANHASQWGRDRFGAPTIVGMEPVPALGGASSDAEREAALALIVPGDCHGLLDAHGGVIFVSESVEKVTGFTPDEYAALDPMERVHRR